MSINFNSTILDDNTPIITDLVDANAMGGHCYVISGYHNQELMVDWMESAGVNVDCLLDAFTGREMAEEWSKIT